MSGSLRRRSTGSSPLLELASFFETARNHTGAIALPSQTLNTVKRYRHQESDHKSSEVDAIVQVIEGTDICERLDPRAVVILCSVFVHSKPCLAQQRGLFLLSEALRTTHTDSVEASEVKQTKRNFVGPQAFNALIKGFVDSEGPDQSRRWMGVLALVLLDSPQTTALVLSDSVKMRALSDVIKHGRCQVLKLIAGSIIRKLLEEGISAEDLWPAETDREIYTRFPRATSCDSQWITAFEGFADDLQEGEYLTQDRADVLFAHAVLVGNVRYETEDESVILVTISEMLNIVIISAAADSALYIDIPLNTIQSVALDKKLSTQSQIPTYGLLILLDQESDIGYYINAVYHDDPAIALAFTAENDARALREILQIEIRNRVESLVVSQSEAVDVSQPLNKDDSGRTIPRTARNVIGAVPQAASSAASEKRSGKSFAVQPEVRDSVQDIESYVSKASEAIYCGEIDEDDAEKHKDSPVQTSSDLGVGLQGSDSRAACTPAKQPALFERICSKSHQEVDREPSRDIHQRENQDQDFDSSYDISPETAEARDQQMKGSVSLGIGTSPIGTAAKSVNMEKVEVPIKDRAPKLSKSLRDANGDSKLASKTAPRPNRYGRRTPPVPKVTANAEKRGQKALMVPRKAARKRSKASPLEKPMKNDGDNDKIANRGEKVEAMSLPASKTLSRPSRQVPDTLPGAANTRSSDARPRCVGKPSGRIENSDEEETIWDVNGSDHEEPANLLRPRNEKLAARARKVKIGNALKSQTSKNPRKESRSVPKKASIHSKISNVQVPEESLSRKNPVRAILGLPTQNRGITVKANSGFQRPDVLDEVSDNETGSISKPGNEPPAAPLTPSRLSDPVASAKVKHGMTKNTKHSYSHTQLPKGLQVEGKGGPTVSEHTTSLSKIARRSASKSPMYIKSPENVNLIVGSAEEGKLKSTRLANDENAPIKTSDDLRQGLSIDERTPSGNDIVSGGKWVDTSDQVSAMKSISNMQDFKAETSDKIIASPVIGDRIECDEGNMVGEKEDSHFTDAFPDADYVAPYTEVMSVRDDSKVASSAVEPENLALAAQNDRQDIKRSDQGMANMPLEAIITTSIPLGSRGRDNKSQTDLKVFSKTGKQLASDEVKIDQIISAQSMSSVVAKSVTNANATTPSQIYEGSHEKSRGLQGEKNPTIHRLTGNIKSPPKTVSKPTTVSKATVHRIARATQTTGGISPKNALVVPPTRGLKSDDYHQEAQDTPVIPAERGLETQEILSKQNFRVKRHPHPRGVDCTARHPQKICNMNTSPCPRPANREKSTESHSIVTNLDDDTRISDSKVSAATSASDECQQDATSLLKVSRRTAIISFGASGPRNQGPIVVGSIRNSKSAKNADVDLNDRLPHEGKNLKRKFAPYHDDPAPREHEQVVKKPKKAKHTPLTKHDCVPQILTQANPDPRRVQLCRPGSLNNRVTENGSPMASIYARNSLDALSNIRVEDDGYMVLDQHYNEDDGSLLIAQDCWDEPTFLVPQRVSMSHDADTKIRGIPNNRKQQPSSPHAPSATATMEAHHICNDGKIVNSRTMIPIVPTEPQDPFASVPQTKHPPGSFMAALRRSSEMEAQRLNILTAQDKVVLCPKRQFRGLDQDPEKTLVEVDPPTRKQKKLHHVSSTSSSSASNSLNDISGHSGVSPECEGEGTLQWDTPYEPHQSSMMETLTQISHRLVRHLVDKETAIKDILDDYSTVGNNLVGGYEKECQKQVDAYVAKVYGSRQEIAGFIKRAQGGRSQISKAMGRRPIKDVEAKWNVEQQRLRAIMEAELTYCT